MKLNSHWIVTLGTLLGLGLLFGPMPEETTSKSIPPSNTSKETKPAAKTLVIKPCGCGQKQAQVDRSTGQPIATTTAQFICPAFDYMQYINYWAYYALECPEENPISWEGPPDQCNNGGGYCEYDCANGGAPCVPVGPVSHIQGMISAPVKAVEATKKVKKAATKGIKPKQDPRNLPLTNAEMDPKHQPKFGAAVKQKLGPVLVEFPNPLNPKEKIRAKTWVLLVVPDYKLLEKNGVKAAKTKFPPMVACHGAQTKIVDTSSPIIRASTRNVKVTGKFQCRVKLGNGPEYLVHTGTALKK